MVITKIKYWSKAVADENVEHVRIAYIDNEGNGTEITMHESGPNAVGTEEFYSAFANLPPYVCLICGLNEQYKTGIFCRDVSIAPSEDKDGNDTTRYDLMCTMKAGHANAVLSVSVQHKFIPEGFAEAIEQLIAAAEKYVKGERNQLNVFGQKSEELENDIENSEAEESDLFNNDQENNEE